jgi:hypothetical protein
MWIEWAKSDADFATIFARKNRPSNVARREGPEFASNSGAVSVPETVLATPLVVFGGDLRCASH